MRTSLHVLRTLALALWVGSIAFFAFGVAPVAFHVLPTTHEAGLMVSGSLRVLHAIGLGCGVLFLLAGVASLVARPLPDLQIGRKLLVSIPIVLAMICLTVYSAFSIVPRMERDRIAAGGVIDSVPASTPARMDFDRLHHRSEQVEGSILLLGLLAMILIATEYPIPRADLKRL